MLNVDPLSLVGVVVSSSEALLGVTDKILIFINEAENAHPSIQGVNEEVGFLRRTLDAINDSLAGLSQTGTKAKVGDTGGLWAEAYKSLRDSGLTIHQLYDCLKGFKSESHDGEDGKMMPIQFTRRELQLQTLKSRVKTHNTTLQLVLQMISAHLCSLSLVMTNDDLGAKIETLVDKISQLQVSQNSKADGEMQEDFRISALLSSPANLLEAAQQVALDANTIFVQGEKGSELSGTINRRTQSRIDEWIDIHTSANESLEKGEGRQIAGNDFAGTETSSSRSIAQLTPIQSTIAEQTENDNEDESDGGDDLEVEVINSSLKIADAEFEKGNYPAAELWYDKAIGLAQRLSVHRQKALGLADLGVNSTIKIAAARFDKQDYQAAELGYRRALSLFQQPSANRRNELRLRVLPEISLRLAICCFHLQRFTEAEGSLQDVLSSPVNSKDEGIQSLAATYLLAEIHLSTQHLNIAEKECRRALGGRRKILGKLHKSYLRAVALLSIILETKDDTISAKMYCELVENTLDTLANSSEIPKAPFSDVDLIDEPIHELRGVSPIDVLLGVREIKEKLVNGQEGPFDMTALLYQAAQEGFAPAVQLLLTGCSPNSYIPFLPQLRFKDSNPDQPFVPRIQFEHHSPNQPNPKPANPWNCGVPRLPEHGVLLHVAVIKGHLAITELLLDAGFDVNAQDCNGATPLHYLFHSPLDSEPRIRNVNVGVVKLLLKRGSSGHIPDLSGQVPEMYHPLNGVENIRTYHSFILEEGLDSLEYQRQREANTWRAIELGSKDVLGVLLDFGVSPHLKDTDSSTISGISYRNANKAKKYQIGDAVGVHKLLLARIEADERAAKQAEWKATREARAAK